MDSNRGELVNMEVDDTTDDIHIIEWRIINFLACILETGEEMRSPVSVAGNFYDTRWVLVMYPKGRKEEPNFLGCFLKRDGKEEVGPETVRIELEFSLTTFDGMETFKKRASAVFKRGTCFGYPKFVKLEDIASSKEFLLQSGTLTLRCKLRALPPETKQTSHHVFLTKFPKEKVSTYLTLDNFRSICKENPKVLNVKGSEDLLTLYVSTDKDKIPEDEFLENGDGREKPGTSKSFLHIRMVKKEAKDPINVSCLIRLLNKNLEAAIEKEISHTFSKIDEKEDYVLPYFIDLNNLRDDCIEKGSIYLHFEFTICHSQEQSLQTANWIPLKARKNPMETSLMKDMEDLHKTKKYSDVTLRVGDETFPAHKSILAARSPRFEEIFARSTKEKTNCENSFEEIDDVDKSIMSLMLKFIYTDQLEDINDERCLLLYSAARKYQISSLLFKCRSILRENLSIKAIYKVLLIAEEFGDSDLKDIALDLILEHYEYVLLTPEWQAFTEEHEELGNQVMGLLRLKKQQLQD